MATAMMDHTHTPLRTPTHNTHHTPSSAPSSSPSSAPSHIHTHTPGLWISTGKHDLAHIGIPLQAITRVDPCPVLHSLRSQHTGDREEEEGEGEEGEGGEGGAAEGGVHSVRSSVVAEPQGAGVSPQGSNSDDNTTSAVEASEMKDEQTSEPEELGQQQQPNPMPGQTAAATTTEVVGVALELCLSISYRINIAEGGDGYEDTIVLEASSAEEHLKWTAALRKVRVY